MKQLRESMAVVYDGDVQGSKREGGGRCRASASLLTGRRSRFMGKPVWQASRFRHLSSSGLLSG